MAKFRKRQVVIEAVQFDGENYNEIVSFTKGNAVVEESGTNDLLNKKITITTIHQGQKVDLVSGDWVIPESDGIHFYPCKPDVFEKTYEVVD